MGLQSVMRGSSALERPTGFTRMHGCPPQCATAGLPAKYVAHLKTLVGIQEAADMEDLNIDEWRHMPETDQIVC